MSLLVQILAIAVLVWYSYLLLSSKHKAKVLPWAMGVIMVAGTGLYMYAFRLEGYVMGVFSNFFRSFLSAAKLFIYDNDLNEIHHAQSRPLFMDFFMAVYYGAVLTSTSALLMLIGKRARTSLLLAFRKKKFRHVFLGVNGRSIMIARGIKDQEIAFIDFPDKSNENKASLPYILKSMSGGDEDAVSQSMRHIRVFTAKRPLTLRSTAYGAFGQMGLARMAKLVDRDTSFYIMSDDMEANMHDLLALVSDPQLRENTVHACVKREGLAAQYQRVLDHTGAHFVYPSSLSVVGLMTNPTCHPANAIARVYDSEGNATGAARSDFHFDAMVVGFGETGQAVLKFLYEFSSAVTPDLRPMPMSIYVQDSQMDRIKGPFLFANPNLAGDNDIVFEDKGSDSSIFWDRLRERINDMNYIQISLGSDAANFELALKIYSYVEKFRRDRFENFMLVVRKSYTPEYELRLQARLNERAGHDVIVFYGENEKIFKPEMIVSKDESGISSTAVAKAEKIKQNYISVTGRQIARSDAGMTYPEKRRARRETHQLISRANHIASKLIFTDFDVELTPEKLENLAALEHLRFSRYMLLRGYTYGPEDDDVKLTSSHLCAWADLPDEKKQYHRDMVRASLSVF